MLLSLLDVRTVLVGYVVVDALCLFVIAGLYRQYRRRSPEIGLWVVDYAMQFAGLLLVALRGAIPLLFSAVVANVLVVLGTVILFQGLERYLGQRGPQLHNYVLVGLFASVHAYFLYVDDNLAVRTAALSVALGLVCAQIAWLMFVRTSRELRAATRATGIVLSGYVVLNVARVVGAANGLETGAFLKSGVDAGAILGYEILYVSLTFALLLLVSRRILTELESDILQRRSVEEALKRSEEKFAVAFHAVPDSIILTLLSSGRIIEANRSSFEVFGLTKDEMVGDTTLALGMWAEPGDRERFVQELQRSGSVSEFEASFRKKSGEIFPASVSSEVIEVSGVPCALTVIHDSTERILAEERLRELSERDPLTSILNRRTFHEVANQRLAEPRTSRTALLFMDLDDMKAINDEYGHSAGDRALVAFAEVLREGFRESDVIGRLGGDEFAVLALPRGEATEETLTQRFKSALDRRNSSREDPFELKASVGIVWSDPSRGPVDLERLIDEADARMYEAKRSGRSV